ncbi:hypothetical protein JYU05_01215, partial [bacterium AH-315-P13]|nr:hypothetical protein [bacterium AH-315-P13]
LVTLFYSAIAGIIGAVIITIIRRVSKPKTSIAWDILTFAISFCVVGLIVAGITVLIMFQAITNH